MTGLSADQVALLVGMITAASAVVGTALGAAVSYLIARQQLRATVRSTNRQEWINTVRDTIAELTALALTVEGLSGLKGGGEAAVPIVMETVKRLVLLQRKLELLINPNEPAHADLMLSVNKFVLGTLAGPMGRKPSTPVDVEQESLRVTRLAQTILKQEWERVKKGK